ncbi:acylphosphatase [Cellulomonas sp. ES6]|uniref:acylphosphatase n=1 Tax=Cellulomonas sp. ES6 TaxID=3039384 RepID=UPI0024B78092|nr:acylphosphatase [Cellulomonas sp. ES6]WHP16868.1 acylphosphatase [Cellulomonas sp. ES6]
MIARTVVVHGVVQGVGFRASMAAEARRLGVTGHVRNRPDGTVEAHVEGPQDAVAALVDWARRGPRFSEVTHVDVRDAVPSGAESFVVER